MSSMCGMVFDCKGIHCGSCMAGVDVLVRHHEVCGFFFEFCQRGCDLGIMLDDLCLSVGPKAGGMTCVIRLLLRWDIGVFPGWHHTSPSTLAEQ